MNFQNKPVSLLTAFILSTSLFIFSCKKEKSGNNNPTDREQATLVASEANVAAETVFNDVFDNVIGVNNDVGIEGTGVFGRYMNSGSSASERPNGCFTVAITALNAPNKFPLQIVIDFGAGCEGKDGRVRKGKIISTYTGRLITTGSSATTTFDGYYVNDLKVEGTHIITNTSSSNNRQFTIDIEDAKLSDASGNYISWENHKTITQTEGLATPVLAADDIFTIEGNSEGQVKKSDILAIWTSEITEPLIKKFLCWWIVQGKVKTVLGAANANDQWVAELDFGPGTCDRDAVITINGATHEISLH